MDIEKLTDEDVDNLVRSMVEEFNTMMGNFIVNRLMLTKDTARDALTREVLRPWEWPGDHVICERYRWTREMDPQSGIAFQAGVCLSRDDNDIVNVKMYVTPYSDGKKTNLGSCMQEGDVDEVQVN